MPPNQSGSVPLPGARRSRADGPVSGVFGGTCLGRYRILGFLGAGSNADVFLAHELSNPDAKVVVKRIKPHVLQNPRFRQFFDNEVRSMARFSHPYAVKLLDASLDDPLGPCLVLEYIPGVTLEQVITKFHRLPVDRVALITGKLCHALQAAHKAGIVHRDLKPANIMIMDIGTPHESLKVMDFGFAGFTAKPHIQLAELTGQGQIFACGTPAYVSPEMVRGDSVDGRADLYGVGVMVYEMLTGRLPFEQEQQDELLAAHVREQPPKFHKIGVTHVLPQVEAVAQIALSKYANERQQTAKDLCDMFGRAIGVDLWAETAPAGFAAAPVEDNEIVECAVADPAAGAELPEDRFVLFDQFEAMLPEKLAAIKLRGFIEDVGGVAVASEPGLIRVRVDLPAGYKDSSSSSSAIMSWISAVRRPSVSRGREPIEIDLRMEKIDANRVSVIVSFRPLKEYLPTDPKVWGERCEGFYTVLRRYVMASS